MSKQEIEAKFGPVLLEFPICRIAWEMDAKGWITKGANNNQLILTDHGQPYIAQLAELQEIETEYQNYSRALAEAAQLLVG